MKTEKEYKDAIDTILTYKKEQLELSKIKAKKKNKTSIPKENWGVHITHCCFEHGCKYGDKDCPVELGLVEQEYPCEICSDNEQDPYIYIEKEIQKK